MGEQNDLVERLYYWTDDESGYDQHYRSSNVKDDEKVIQIKRLNFFIGRNNSGKSRFLRGCFRAGKRPRHFTPMQNWVEDALLKLDDALNQYGNNKNWLISPPNKRSPDGERKNIGTEMLNDMVSQAKTQLLESANCYRSKSDLMGYSFCLPNFDTIDSLAELTPRNSSNPNFFKQNLSYLIDYRKQFKSKIELLDFRKSFYTPTLRGLRPTQPKESSSKTPYADRTIKDYFDPTKQKAENVITGENLYIELTQALLGEPKQRESVREYEKSLSQYFFDGATISLIPKYGEDTVSIKIGDDDQRSVTQLGDGLQQVLILTYEAFLKKERCAFFIEEPELHMHAGMLRQLMNFYLNETDHFYFFTTHSNHLVDMVDESSEVMIQKFQKRQDPETKQSYFQINQCDRDRDLLAQLGVRPSSVYLSNCTIWVEGITDRLYIHRYMQRYLQDLKDEKSALYAKYQRFMPNYHYSFVEYQGAGIVHWNFNEEQETVTANDRGLDAHAACAAPLLVADGDVDKKDRVAVLTKALGGKFQKLPCKEIENTLPKLIILKAAETTFSSRIKDKAFEVEELHQSLTEKHFDSPDIGVGRLLDQILNLPPMQVRHPKTGKMEAKPTLCLATKSGTIDKKVDFCRNAITAMDKLDHEEWELTDSAKALCERIFQHIADQNR